jgi:hypothetical protein
MARKNKNRWKELREQMFPEVEIKDSFVTDADRDFIFPTIKYVKGNKVDSEGNIAWTDYGTNTVKMADLGEIFENISRDLEPIYRRVHGAILGYVEGHELNVEVAGKPQSEMEHGRLESQYLDSIEGSIEYVAGLALHKLRKEGGNKKGRWFTKYTNYFHDLEDKFDKYSAELDEMGGLVSDVIEGKPTFQHQADSGLERTYQIGDYRTGGIERLAKAA